MDLVINLIQRIKMLKFDNGSLKDH